MRDDENAAAACAQAIDIGAQRGEAKAVEAGGWLIERDEPRLGRREREGECDAAQFAVAMRQGMARFIRRDSVRLKLGRDITPGEAAPRSHHDYLRAEIFRRADLHETGFVGDYGPNARVAQPIHRRPPVFDQPDWLKGSADVASSASDLFNWNGALMSGRVIPAEAWRLMVSDGARVTPSIYYGMGWFVEHRPAHDVYFHSGLVPGFTSHNIIAAAKAGPSWTSVTLLLNTDGVDGLEQLAEELLRLASD